MGYQREIRCEKSTWWTLHRCPEKRGDHEAAHRVLARLPTKDEEILPFVHLCLQQKRRYILTPMQDTALGTGITIINKIRVSLGNKVIVIPYPKTVFVAQNTQDIYHILYHSRLPYSKVYRIYLVYRKNWSITTKKCVKGNKTGFWSSGNFLWHLCLPARPTTTIMPT